MRVRVLSCALPLLIAVAVVVPASGASAERDMIRSLGVRMNDVIDRAAAAAGATSVTTDLEVRFTGHEDCQNTSNDWIYGLSLFSAAGQPTGLVVADGGR